MDTEFGPTLNPNQFEPPFDEIVEELVQKGQLLNKLLRNCMQPPWSQRLQEILIVDNPELNAITAVHVDHDRIYIYRGALERIYGSIFGVLSTPAFFPAIGNVKVGVPPENMAAGGFPPIPLLRDVFRPGQNTPILFPNDQTRMSIAQILAELALEFLLYHEIGHIVGGHLEIFQANYSEMQIS